MKEYTVKVYEPGDYEKADAYGYGATEWYNKDGKLHREDGAAVDVVNQWLTISKRGRKQHWFLDGIAYSEDQWKAELAKRNAPKPKQPQAERMELCPGMLYEFDGKKYKLTEVQPAIPATKFVKTIDSDRLECPPVSNGDRCYVVRQEMNDEFAHSFEYYNEDTGWEFEANKTTLLNKVDAKAVAKVMKDPPSDGRVHIAKRVKKQVKPAKDVGGFEYVVRRRVGDGRLDWYNEYKGCWVMDAKDASLFSRDEAFEVKAKLPGHQVHIARRVKKASKPQKQYVVRLVSKHQGGDKYWWYGDDYGSGWTNASSRADLYSRKQALKIAKEVDTSVYVDTANERVYVAKRTKKGNQ